jgi:hypothetical protein
MIIKRNKLFYEKMSESVDSPTGWLPDPSPEDFFQNIICVAYTNFVTILIVTFYDNYSNLCQ